MRAAFVSLTAGVLRALPRTSRVPLAARPARAAVRRTRISAECGKNVPYSERSMATSEEDMVMTAVHKKITAALSPTRLRVEPTYGDPNGSHVTITVVSDRFEGWGMVKRHQAVYKAIWDELQGPIHAVDQLVTKTPSEDSA